MLTSSAPAAAFEPQSRAYEVWSAKEPQQHVLSLDADPILGPIRSRLVAAASDLLGARLVRHPDGRADAHLDCKGGCLALLKLPQAVADQWEASGVLVVEFDDQGPFREHFLPAAKQAASL
jgi:hypothetical protein